MKKEQKRQKTNIGSRGVVSACATLGRSLALVVHTAHGVLLHLTQGSRVKKKKKNDEAEEAGKEYWEGGSSLSLRYFGKVTRRPEYQKVIKSRFMKRNKFERRR